MSSLGNKAIKSISSEDLKHCFKTNSKIEVEYDWLCYDYFYYYSSLDSSIQNPHRKWIPDRRSDIAIAKWKTGMIPSNQTLHKLNLSPTPVCTSHDIDTLNNKLQSCAKYHLPRKDLFKSSLQTLHTAILSTWGCNASSSTTLTLYLVSFMFTLFCLSSLTVCYHLFSNLYISFTSLSL